MSRKAVVIGGSGFLGSHIADVLTNQGLQVSIYDMYKSPWLRDDQKMYEGSILDFEALRDCIDGADYVYHLAGVADIGQAAASPTATVEQNIMGSAHVLDACAAAGIDRLMFASTVYVYSDQGSFYRVSKQAVELLIEAYHEKTGLNYSILRYGSLYGPRAQEWNGLRRYVVQAIKDKRIVFYGTGEEAREYINVLDAARMSVTALDERYINKCLMITGNQKLLLKEVLQIITEILRGDCEIEMQPDNRDPTHYAITPYRYTPRAAVKIVPQEFIDIGQGILDIVEEIDQQGAEGDGFLKNRV